MNASSTKKSQGGNLQPDNKINVSDNSIDKDKYQEGTGHREAMKYLKGRPLNSAALTAPAHRGLERVSNGTSTQVVAWMISKWRAKIV